MQRQSLDNLPPGFINQPITTHYSPCNAKALTISDQALSQPNNHNSLFTMQRRSPDDFRPSFVNQPIRGRIWVRISQSDAAGQQKAPFSVFDDAARFEDRDRQNERKQQFILLQ